MRGLEGGISGGEARGGEEQRVYLKLKPILPRSLGRQC